MSAGKKRMIYAALTGVSLMMAVGFWLVTVRFSRAFIPEAVASTMLMLAFGYRLFHLRCVGPSSD